MTSPAAAGRVRRLSPRKRAQRIRWVQYAVLVAAVALLIAVADLRQIQKVFFRGDLIVDTLTQGLGREIGRASCRERV